MTLFQAFGAFAGQSEPPYEFLGGNQTVGSIYELAELMGESATTQTPTSGGTLTVNSISLSSYDYTIKQGNQTISSFTASDWFTNTEDTRSAFIAVNGNLTINSGQTVIPGVRKLFTCIYVAGDLTVNGSISMTARGANHSGTGNSGGATTKNDIRIITGTYGGVSNPQVPTNGGAGGTWNSNGSAGSSGGTGGGGAGQNDNANKGLGSAGTSFTGGTGGGGARVYPSPGGTQFGGDGVANGGKGGFAGANSYASVGGTGNPGGDTCIPLSSWGGATACAAGSTGTAGILFVIVRGALIGSGSIVAQGTQGATVASVQRGGGSSGGGSITVLYGSDSSSITPSAAGGVGSAQGYAGGAGTARKLALV